MMFYLDPEFTNKINKINNVLHSPLGFVQYRRCHGIFTSTNIPKFETYSHKYPRIELGTARLIG